MKVNIMIREKTDKHELLVIDLTGPEGNAFNLLGIANRYAKTLNLNVEKIINEMKSGDYENLVNVFDKYFGDFIILER